MYMNRHAMQSAAAYRIFPESETKPENRRQCKPLQDIPTRPFGGACPEHSFFTLCAAVALSACTSTPNGWLGPRLEPIPGQHYLWRSTANEADEAPIGSMVPHQFFDTYGHGSMRPMSLIRTLVATDQPPHRLRIFSD